MRSRRWSCPTSEPVSPRTRRRSSMSRRLTAAYYDVRPDPSDPAQRVAFGTSGHRGSAFRPRSTRRTSSPSTEAICRYRAAQGIRRPAVHRPRHATRCPSRRCARPLEVLVANGVDVRVDARRRLHADAGGLARDPRRTTADRDGRAGRRHRRHAVAQPARGRRLQVQPAQRRPGRHRRHALDRGRGERAARGAASRARRRRARRLRARQRDARPAYDFLARYVDDLAARHRHGRRSRASGLRLGRGSAGRRERRLLGRHRRAATAST